jgi:hypothetical protein
MNKFLNGIPLYSFGDPCLPSDPLWTELATKTKFSLTVFPQLHKIGENMGSFVMESRDRGTSANGIVKLTYSTRLFHVLRALMNSVWKCWPDQYRKRKRIHEHLRVLLEELRKTDPIHLCGSRREITMMVFGEPAKWTTDRLLKYAERGLNTLLLNASEFQRKLVSVSDYLKQCTLMLKQAEIRGCFKITRQDFQSTIQVVDVLGQFGFSAARYSPWMNLLDTWSPPIGRLAEKRLKRQKRELTFVEFRELREDDWFWRRPPAPPRAGPNWREQEPYRAGASMGIANRLKMIETVMRESECTIAKGRYQYRSAKGHLICSASTAGEAAEKLVSKYGDSWRANINPRHFKK